MRNSPEARRKISLSLTGFKRGPQTAEHKARMVITRQKNGSYRKGLGKGRTEQGRKNSALAKKNWKLAHPEEVKQIARIRSYRMRGASGAHTSRQWEDLKKLYNYMCLCCKRQEPFIKLTEDHIVPVSLGGSNDISNIQPLCRSCNSRKFTEIISYIPCHAATNSKQK